MIPLRENLNLRIRIAVPEDLPIILKLFTETIRHTCHKDYSPQQLEAWINTANTNDRWKGRLTNQYFIVAQAKDEIVGFASLANDYLDLIYVHKDFQRQGVAQKLLEEMEQETRKRGFHTLQAEVSITARPFFESNGFHIIHENKKWIQGVEVINYTAKKEGI